MRPDQQDPTFRQRYTEFVVNHNVGLRRLGVATAIAGLPLGAFLGAEIGISLPEGSFIVMCIGGIEYALGVEGHSIEARQQGSDTV